MNYKLLIFIIVLSIILYSLIINIRNIFSERAGNKIIEKATGNITSWNPAYFSSPEKYANFWRNKKEKIKDLLIGIKPNKEYKDTAVIHFRCSDVPFVKHREYTLLPKEYFIFVSDKIKEKNIKNIVIVTCNKHSKNSLSYKCSDYSLTIKEWLENFTDLPVSIDDSCKSIKDTYEIFTGSKIFVSTGGSFSFAPGILKDKDFISPSLLGDIDKKGFEDLNKLVHWTMWDKFDRISHDVDYNTFIYK